MMEPKNALIETSFSLLKTKIYKETIHPMDTTAGESWASTLYWIKEKKLNKTVVSTSSSSPTLPLIIQRSTTGSSLSSTQSSISPRLLGSPKKSNPKKRARVVQELIETEKEYDADLRLVQEIYYAQAPLNAFQKKQIFLNLNELLLFEHDFLFHLSALSVEDLRPLCLLFSTMMGSIEVVYADYCKRHKDALHKLQELTQTNKEVQDYFKTCTQTIQGRTKSWDLPSLLIKPVQRILKYPLLFKEILSYTAEDDVAYESLVFIHHTLELVADHINEIKKRKDIVEQLLVNDHKKKVVHGLNKRWTRKVHLKRNPSMDTQDMVFNEIYRQFEERQQKAKEFEKEVLHWFALLKEGHDNLEGFLIAFGKQSTLQQQMAKDLAVTEAMIQVSVCDRIEAFLKLFKNPTLIIQKRNRKWIDYDRACHITARGEVPDKPLQVSTEAYHSLNSHLLEELPLFLNLASSYFDIILDEFVGIQAFFWKQRELAWRPLLQTTKEKKQEEAVMSWADFLHGTETIETEGIFDQPVLEVVALVDYETKEHVKVKKGDPIQIWLVTSHQKEQWWYGSGPRSSASGWFPSHVCKK